ncbi:hypothetical protein PoB_004230000 [Plakobranchus ocellatus]|uniref:Uncharacterized protein n=1 Tax=Plakobranchus ocellatus TaxID=259542 RepID=A0AAV4B9M2_9GAST|nr:hypothetical protein PoB_004230000 [Plakobranchus ocellatus]
MPVAVKGMDRSAQGWMAPFAPPMRRKNVTMWGESCVTVSDVRIDTKEISQCVEKERKREKTDRKKGKRGNEEERNRLRKGGIRERHGEGVEQKNDED